MLKNIAEITGFPFNEKDSVVMTVLTRIQRKLPAKFLAEGAESLKGFEAAVLKAEAEVNAEGNMAICSLVKQITAPAPEKVLKIKSSPKGARIKVAAANGVRFSFGPIWNESVKKAKGIAVAECNRAKLIHQGIMAGVADAEKMEVGALCAAITKTF